MGMENTTATATAPTTDAPGTTAPRPSFRMYRSRTDRMLGGVCGGLAEALDVDAALVRIGLVALTILGGGIGIPLYVAAWVLAPEGAPAPATTLV
jgi:phage shock protein C